MRYRLSLSTKQFLQACPNPTGTESQSEEISASFPG